MVQGERRATVAAALVARNLSAHARTSTHTHIQASVSQSDTKCLNIFLLLFLLLLLLLLLQFVQCADVALSVLCLNF